MLFRSDLLIYLLEKKAEKLEVERFKIYTFEELLSEVADKKIPNNHEEPTTLDKIIERVDILPIFNKDEIILNIADILFRRD